VNENAEILWEKEVSGIIQTDSNGITYLAAGNGIQKYDPDGNKIWHINAWMAGSFQQIALFPGGGCIVGGQEFSGDTTRSLLQRYDASGNLLWTNYGHYGILNRPLTTDEAGNTYIYTEGLPEQGTINVGRIFKYDAVGSKVFEKTVPHQSNTIRVDKEGNIILLGGFCAQNPIEINHQVLNSPTAYSISTTFLVKLDSQGNTQWYRLFTGTFGQQALTLDNENNIYVTIDYSVVKTDGIALTSLDKGGDESGGSESLVIKFKPDGGMVWYTHSTAIDDPESQWGNGTNRTTLTARNNSDAYLIGSVTGRQNFGTQTVFGEDYGDLFIAKLNQSNLVGLEQSSVYNPNHLLYPNPSGDRFYLSFPDTEGPAAISVMDVTGRLIIQWSPEKIEGSQYEIDLSAQPKGIYFLHVTSGEKSMVKKLVRN
jgi:hypothetical protein